MAIVKQFKLFNLNQKNEKVIHWWNKKGQNEEIWKKTRFAIQKNIFPLFYFFGCSFGFAFQRWFVKLEKALLQHFKSFKMGKNREKIAKMFNDKLVLSDRVVYPMVLYKKWKIWI
jgi:hypothetical protein